MDSDYPLLLFWLPLLVPFILCRWQVLVAFLLVSFTVPFFFTFLFGVFGMVFQGEVFDPGMWLGMGMLFAIPGIPIHLLAILPLYYLMRSRSFPLHITFPCCVAAVFLACFIMLAEKSVPYVAFLIIVGCAIVHALLIMWLIEKFNASSS